MNTVNARVWYICLEFAFSYPVKMQNWMWFIKVVRKMFPPRPNMSFGGDISLTNLHNIYEWMGTWVRGRVCVWGGGGGGGGVHIFWILPGTETEFKSDIPDMRIDCIHLTIISQNKNLNIVISEICSSTPEPVRENPRLSAYTCISFFLKGSKSFSF